MPQPGPFSDDDTQILNAVGELLETLRDHFDRQEIHKGLTAVWKVIGDANAYFAAQEPWALKKTDPERVNTVLYVTAEVIRQLAILVQPVIPDSCAKLLEQLGVSADARDFASLGQSGRVAPGTPLPKPQGVFPRVMEEEGP